MVGISAMVGVLVGWTWPVPRGTAQRWVLVTSVRCSATCSAYNPTEQSTEPLNGSLCGAANMLSARNLNTTPSDSASAGYRIRSTTPPSELLAGVPSTKSGAETAKSDVLLPGLQGTGSGRYVLGPAQMTSVGTITSASAEKQFGQWVVNFKMTPKGQRLWDTVTYADFHRILGMDLNGVVVSAPIVQPTQYEFTSFRMDWADRRQPDQSRGKEDRPRFDRDERPRDPGLALRG